MKRHPRRLILLCCRRWPSTSRMRFICEWRQQFDLEWSGKSPQYFREFFVITVGGDVVTPRCVLNCPTVVKSGLFIKRKIQHPRLVYRTTQQIFLWEIFIGLLCFSIYKVKKKKITIKNIKQEIEGTSLF